MKKLDELKALWDAQADEYNKWGALGLDEMVEFAQKIAREDCARQLELTPSEVRLMAGEMSAQEMRTVQAVLGGLRHRICPEGLATRDGATSGTQPG